VSPTRGGKTWCRRDPPPADAGERETLIRMLEQQMQAAAEELDFELAAVLRDQLLELKADAPLRERAQSVR